jgi:hypothetical protein
MEPPDEAAAKRARISAKEEQLLDEAGADAVDQEMDKAVRCCGCLPGNDGSKTEATRVMKETIIRRYSHQWLHCTSVGLDSLASEQLSSSDSEVWSAKMNRLI